MEEQIKKSWESVFKFSTKNLEGKSAEDVAAMFFEIGWKAGVDNEHNTIAEAIKVLNTINVK